MSMGELVRRLEISVVDGFRGRVRRTVDRRDFLNRNPRSLDCRADRLVGGLKERVFACEQGTRTGLSYHVMGWGLRELVEEAVESGS